MIFFIFLKSKKKESEISKIQKSITKTIENLLATQKQIKLSDGFKSLFPSEWNVNTLEDVKETLSEANVNRLKFLALDSSSGISLLDLYKSIELEISTLQV